MASRPGDPDYDAFMRWRNSLPETRIGAILGPHEDEDEEEIDEGYDPTFDDDIEEEQRRGR